MAVKSTFGNMVLSLGVITLVCSTLLGGVYVLTEGPIAESARQKQISAIAAVTPEFDRLEEMAAEDGSSYYVACDAAGEVVAYALNASSVGFGGPLCLMVGFLPDGTIYGTSVLSHSETPGLGAKCDSPEFYQQFKGFNPAESILCVRKDGGDVDAITASTITSRAYCAALQNAVDFFGTICPAKEEEPETVMEEMNEIIEEVQENE